MLAIALDVLLIGITCVLYFARPYLNRCKWISQVLSRRLGSLKESLELTRTWFQVKVGQLRPADVKLVQFGRAIQKATKDADTELLGQFEGDQRTSGLILYYIQLYSDNLICLYVLVSRLLECARLIQAEANLGERQEEEEEGQLEAMNASRKESNAGAESGLLDRYALLLMVVAYLESSSHAAAATADGVNNEPARTSGRKRKQGKAAATNNEQLALTTNLLGFLECYASELPSAGQRLKEKESKSGKGAIISSAHVSKTSFLVHGCKLSSRSSLASQESGHAVEKSTTMSRVQLVKVDPSPCEKLIVLDPLESDTLVPEELEKISTLTDRGANLTCHLAVWPEIRHLFYELSEKLTNDLELSPDDDDDDDRQPSDSQTVRSSNEKRRQQQQRQRNASSEAKVDSGLRILEELFEFCTSRGLKSSRLPGGGKSKKADELLIESPIKMDGEHSKHQRPGRRTHEINNRGKKSEEAGALSQSSGLAATWARLKQKKLVKNLLYLALFIFVRTVLIRYLEDVQRDLRYQARGDFINLKRMLFPELQMAQLEKERADAETDGISILLRENEEEKEEDEIINEHARGATGQEASVASESYKKTEGLSEEEQGAQVIEALLTAILSQSMGGMAGGLTPDKLQGVMEILAKSASEGKSESGHGQEDDEMDDEAMARIMEQMQLLMPGVGPAAGFDQDQEEKMITEEEEAEEEDSEAEGDDYDAEERKQSYPDETNINSALGDASDLDHAGNGDNAELGVEDAGDSHQAETHTEEL